MKALAILDSLLAFLWLNIFFFGAIHLFRIWIMKAKNVDFTCYWKISSKLTLVWDFSVDPDDFALCIVPLASTKDREGRKYLIGYRYALWSMSLELRHRKPVTA